MKSAKNIFYQNLVRHFSKTYFLSSLFFPPKIREEVFVLYAFLRLADEIVDHPQANPAQDLSIVKNNFKNLWQQNTSFTIDYRSLNHQIRSNNFNLTAIQSEILQDFIDLAKKLGFELSWVEAFFDSMSQDLVVHSYANWQDLNKYIYGSAEVVGLMMNRIMRVSISYQADQSARSLGWAMQMTNFLRDIKEDSDRKRIYFPLSELKKNHLNSHNWLNNTSSDFLNFVQEQVQTIKQSYQQALSGAHFIPKESRLAVLISMQIYLSVLDKIEKKSSLLWRKDFKKTILMAPRSIFVAYLQNLKIEKQLFLKSKYQLNNLL